jgi:hypothetical protein
MDSRSEIESGYLLNTSEEHYGYTSSFSDGLL